MKQIIKLSFVGLLLLITSCSKENQKLIEEQNNDGEVIESKSLKVSNLSEFLNYYSDSKDLWISKKASTRGSESEYQKDTEDKKGSSCFVIVEFDGFGHGKYCKGWGLCHAVWFPKIKNWLKKIQYADSKNTYGSVLMHNEEDGFYLPLALSEQPKRALSEEDLIFHIDENIELPSSGNDALGKTRFIKKGGYKYDDTIGEYGGYKILVE